jgi:hypothetical protein
MEEVATLFRPVGARELELIRQTGFTAFPPRLTGQPIFYPVLDEGYATRIARDWNTRDPHSEYVGYVLRFRVRAEFLTRYAVHEVGGKAYREYWVPAEDLSEFNSNIVGEIEIVGEYRP